MAAPLAGIKVLELAGLAPAPFAGLVLSDFGADVVRIDRRSSGTTSDSLTRGKRSIALDLKDAEDRALFLELVAKADVLIEGYRPGVMESLGLAPKELQSLNGRLIYARLTGFNREGTWSKAAGHDINYLALSGVLHALGTPDKPMPPANLLGDFAGGGMTCALGVLIALLQRGKTGKGAVVEANMVDGAAYTSTFIRHAQSFKELWGRPRGENLLDGGSPFYQCYETKDKKFVALGALEPQFYQAFLERFGLSEDEMSRCADQDRSNWPHLLHIFRKRFQELTRDEWSKIYDGTDACLTPVLENISPATVPVYVDAYNGLSKEKTHKKNVEKFGLKPGHDQEAVLKEWLKGQDAKL